MAWRTVAKGTSLSDLRATIADMELPSGTKMKVVMDLKAPVGWAFDVAGAEWIFRPYMPDGMTLIDVYGEGSQGILEMEANSPTLLAILAFMKAHWLAIVIGGFILAALISFIVVMIKIPGAAQLPMALIIGAAIGIVGLVILSGKYGK